MVNCTGAGDCLLATVAALTLHGIDMEEAVQIGMKAASVTIQSDKSVSKELNEDWLSEQLLLLSNK